MKNTLANRKYKKWIALLPTHHSVQPMAFINTFINNLLTLIFSAVAADTIIFLNFVLGVVE